MGDKSASSGGVAVSTRDRLASHGSSCSSSLRLSWVEGETSSARGSGGADGSPDVPGATNIAPAAGAASSSVPANCDRDEADRTAGVVAPTNSGVAQTDRGPAAVGTDAAQSTDDAASLRIAE